MLRESKGLKDSGLPLPGLPLVKGEELGGGLSYTRTNKLITALYMVTDTIDNDEPLRNKLRTLGVEIVSDICVAPISALARISQIMSFLDIASAVNVISEMNCNILRREFSQLNQSIQEFAGKDKIAISPADKQVNLSEFFREELPPLERHFRLGHGRSHSVGVQKGSTLLKALRNVEGLKAIKGVSDKIPPPVGFGSESDKNSGAVSPNHFALLKEQRRNDILNIIKDIGGSATIKDIKNKVQATPDISSFIASSSEKTLQRELVSMVKNGVLKKTGEKRWSRYSLVSGA